MLMIVIFHFTLLIDDQAIQGWLPSFGPVYLFSRGKQQSDLNAAPSIFGGG